LLVEEPGRDDEGCDYRYRPLQVIRKRIRFDGSSEKRVCTHRLSMYLT
jgi:hypothetical protein